MKEQLKIPQIEIVTASDPAELQEQINAVLLKHPDVTDINVEADRALIRYVVTIDPPTPPQIETGAPIVPKYSIMFTESTDPAETVRIGIELVLPKITGRSCCDCSNYEWGIGCPYRAGPIRLLDPACSMFNVRIDGYDERHGPAVTTTANQIEMNDIDDNEEE